MSDSEINTEQRASRVVGKPWQKGTSGNPGGRPKGASRRARELIEDSFDDAKKALQAAAKEGESWAVQMVMHYALGKPTDAALELSEVTDEELEAEVERRLAARAGRPEGH